MIIETFGPPGAGKTTFSRALAQRLRERGYTVDFIFEIPRPRVSFLNLGGVVPALLRVAYAMFGILAILCRPGANARGLRLAYELIRLMPPKSPVWRIRLSQYIIRFCSVWEDPHRPDHILLFDQGFVQVVCALAMFSDADSKTIAQAIGMRPPADLLIHFDAPKELLQQRLHERSRRTGFVERWFDPDVQKFLEAKPITDYVASLLANDPRMLSINSLDPNIMLRALNIVEEEISVRMPIDRTARPRRDAEHGSVASDARKLAAAPSPAENIGIALVRSDPELPRRLALASLWAFGVYVGGAGLSFLAQLVIAHRIGATSYGIYSYVLAWTTFLSYVAALGFNNVLLRFVPTYSVTEEWSLARGIIRFAFGRSFLVSIVIAFCGIATVLSLEGHFSRELTASMVIGMATIPLVTLYVLGSAAVRALGGVISAIVPERLVRDGLMIVLLVLAGLLSTTPVDATTVLIALMVSSAVTVGILALNLCKRWPPQLRSVAPSYAPGEWWHLALPVMIMVGVEVLMNRAGVILLGWNGDTHAAGIFALGLNLALFLVLPRLAVGTFFSPNVSKLYANRNEAGLQRLFARATVLSLVGTIVLALPLLLLTAPLLRLFGPEFGATVPIAQILVVGQIFAAATGPQLNLLTMTGHERPAAAIMVIGAAINIFACAMGIAFFGTIGAAVATASTNVIWNTAMVIYIYKRVNMKPGLLFAVANFRRRPAKDSLPQWIADATSGSGVLPYSKDTNSV